MLRNKLLSELKPGEQLVWCESPPPLQFLVEKRGFFLFLMPLLFGAFWGGAFWSTAAVRGETWPAMVVFAALHFCMFVVDALSAFGTLYGITTTRLVMLRPALSATKMTSYYATDIESLTKKRKRDGSGSILFGAVQEQSGKRTVTVPVGFFGIREVDRVETMILALRGLRAPNQVPDPTLPSVTPPAEQEPRRP
jgi:hypothetical protein